MLIKKPVHNHPFFMKIIMIYLLEMPQYAPEVLLLAAAAVYTRSCTRPCHTMTF